MVAFVHDDGTDFDELHAYYKGFKEANPRTAKYMAGFQPMDDRFIPLANGRHDREFDIEIGLDSIENGRKPEILSRMKENVQFINTWDEHYTLSVLKRELMR